MAARSAARVSAAELVRRQSRRHEMMKVLMRSAQRVLPFPRPSPSNVLSAMVGMARCSVPARVVACGTNSRATPAVEGVAPLHTARTSQRDVPTALNTYLPCGEGELFLPRSTIQTFRLSLCGARCSLSLRERVRVRGNGANYPIPYWTIPGAVGLAESSGEAEGFPK